MAGNVWEWTSDWNDSKRIIRGGSYGYSKNWLYTYSQFY